MTTPEAVRALLERLENYYSFECEAGPLRNCVEWIELKCALRTPAADPQGEESAAVAEDFGWPQTRKGPSIKGKMGARRTRPAFYVGDEEEATPLADPQKPRAFPPQKDDDIPLDIKRELMDCAVSNGRISYYYLCDVFRCGHSAALPPSGFPPPAEAAELLVAARAAVAFLDAIEWLDASPENDAANLQHALELAIEKTEAAAARPHPPEEVPATDPLDPNEGHPIYTREEFERDSKGQTGDDLAALHPPEDDATL